MASIVENNLRSQRELWKNIADRALSTSSRDFPPEPAKRILLFGLGSSHHAARLCAYALIRDKTRTRIPIIACSSMDIGVEFIPARGDWAFAFSHRGTSKPTIQALEACERAGAFTLLVTGEGALSSPTQVSSAKYVLTTSPMETVEPHTMAVTGAICAVTTLMLGPKGTEEWDALRSIGDPDLDLLRKRAGKGPAAILGEWEGEWIAREGALKLMEMARLPVRVFRSEEFFHGPRVSVRSDEAIWHVSLPKDPRNDEIRAAHRIGVFGSTPLAWMPALIELQWLALAVATNLGVDPDKTP